MKKLKIISLCKIITALLVAAIFIYRVVDAFNNINNNNYEENKTITGKIVYLKKEDNKTTIDLKNKNKYRIVFYHDFNYELGDTIKVKGFFEYPFNNTVFNCFNYRKYLLTKKIYKISYDPKVFLISKNKNILYTIKNNMLNRVNEYKSKHYIKAFIFGDMDLFDDNQKDNFRKIGIIHIFCVSGMHINTFLLFLNIVFKKNKYKNVFVFLFLLFFLFLTNYSISLLRCLISFVLKKINIKKIKNNLFSFLILLFINPYFIYSIGFWISNIIVFFINVSDKVLSKKSNLFKMLLVSLITFLSSLPIISCNYFEINLLSPIFNFVLIPLISFFVFPFSIITFFIPLFDECFFMLISIFDKIILYISSIKIFLVTIGKPNLIFMFLYYLSLYLSVKVNRKYIVFYIAVLIININIKYLINDYKIIFLDVNQGDQNILILPRGKTIMIDTGGVFYNDGLIIKNKTKPYLNSIGINKINYLLLTHGDYDHMGEAINLVNNFKVEKVIFNCGEFNDLEKELIKVLDKKKIPYYSCIKKLNIDNNKLYFLQTKEYDNENDNSNVIYTEINGYKFMFMGDAGVEKEKDILDKYNISDVDVLKVGHHGSKTSSSKEFINEIDPKYSIISVGKNNRYGHPNKEVLNNLEQSKIYRTDQDGSIMFKIKNNKLKIEICSP